MPSPSAAPEQERHELEIRDYLRILRRRRVVVILGAVIGVCLAIVISLVSTATYMATAQLVIQLNPAEAALNPASGLVSQSANIPTELQVITSAPVMAAVRRQLGQAPPVTATEVGQTDVIDVTASSADPRQAARTANAYANSYIVFRRSQDSTALAAASQQLQARINDLQGQIDVLDTQISRASTAAAATLVTQRNGLISQQGVFKQDVAQLEVGVNVTSAGIQLVTPASPPGSPSSPKPAEDALIGLIVGLVLGLVGAFVREYFDDSVKNRDDLERAAQPGRVLGVIPAVAGWKRESDPLTVSLANPNSAASEAYRSLRTSIQFMGLDRQVRVLQITSPSAREGKTTTVANLAVALAMAGQRVTAVCCDLRRPRLNEFFGLSNEIGFTSVVVGDVPLSTALQAVPHHENLRVLTSGPRPPDPSELLSGQRAMEIFDAVSADSDIVLVDSPPALPVTDAAVISARVDAVLVVAAARLTSRRAVQRTLDVFRQVDAVVAGLVLNGARGAKEDYGYEYGYTYGQSSANDASAGPLALAEDEAPTVNRTAAAGPGGRASRRPRAVSGPSSRQ